MSESSNQRNRRRSERAQQLYNARMMPDAEDTASYEAAPVQDRAAARRQAYEQRLTEPVKPADPIQPVSVQGYDESRFTPNESTGLTQPVPPASVRGYDASRFTPNEATGATFPVRAAAPAPAFAQPEDEPEQLGNLQPASSGNTASSADSAPEPSAERAALAANLSAYYRRAANVSAQEDMDPFTHLDWSLPEEEPQPEAEEDPTANVKLYRMQEASWAQEERQTMLSGEDADGYQIKTEEQRQPAKRRRKKRLIRRTLIGLVAAAAALVGAVILLGDQQPQSIQEQGGFTPVVTTTPQPIRGYDAAPAMAVSGKADEAIDQISGPVEMTTCAVTEGNVLTRSLRADGLYDYYLFASDGRLLAYFDKLPEGSMFPMKDGGFYVNMHPYLISGEGTALIPLEDLEQTTGSAVTLRPLMNGWGRILTGDGKSNLINREGQLLSRLWFSRSFPMTGTESVAYVDTGVEGSATRYTLYVLDSKGNTVKWQDAADDRGVVASALGMAYMQSGELYQLSRLLKDPAAEPLCLTSNVRFYTDCAAMVVQDAVSGKYALYVNGEQHYDFVYDSILPVESDVRWQADILTGTTGQAMVLAVDGGSYPQPLSHYFVLTRDGAQEYVALSAVTNCPILLN